MLEEPRAGSPAIRCYISAPIGTNVESIRSSLMERSVQILTPSALSKAYNLYESTRELITNADLVIGVLRRGRRSQAVLFELGMASALERKIVVFDSPRGGYIPTSLQSNLVLRVSLQNRKAIDFALDQILSAPKSRRKIGGDRLVPHWTLSYHAPGLLGDVEEALEVGDERRFEEIISEGIRHSGVEAVVRSTSERRNMDLAVWADEFQHLMGNPFLIEVRLRLEGDEQIKSVLKRCASATEKSGGRWSLLIYGSGPKIFRKRWLSLAPNVLVISASDLFQQMREKSFVDVVASLRNHRVHGGEH